MTLDEFKALLDRREKLEAEHTRACEMLEEEGPRHAQANYRRCVKLYDQLTEVQAEVDAATAAEEGE